MPPLNTQCAVFSITFRVKNIQNLQEKLTIGAEACKNKHNLCRSSLFKQLIDFNLLLMAFNLVYFMFSVTVSTFFF